jgi:flagella basal body P-ring formation protein FlgA
MKESMRIIVMVAFVLLTGYGLSWAVTDARLDIVARPKASVSGQKIYLDDIARIKGDKDLRKRIGSICLGSAPRPGDTRTLRGRRISTILRSKQFLPSDATITVPETVEVTRTFQVVPIERYKDVFYRYVKDRIGNHTDFSIGNFKVTGNQPVPAGIVALRIADPGNRKMSGYVSVTTFVQVDSESVQRVMLSGWIHLFKEIPCTIHPLEKDTVISKKDVKLVRKDVSKLPSNIVLDIQAVIGKRLKHSVRHGAYLRENMLDEVPAVNRGDQVVIVAESGAIKVTVRGETLEKGCPGDTIRVKNAMSKKIISAEVIDASTVRVRF